MPASSLFWSPGDEDNLLHPGDDRKAGENTGHFSGYSGASYPTARLEQLIGGLSVCDAMVCSGWRCDAYRRRTGAANRLFLWQIRTPVAGIPGECLYELLQKPSGDVNDISVDAALDAYHRLVARTGA